MIHHYGSALNAIPVLNQYREYPSDFYLLRVGFGGVMGAISNITQDGFAPTAFHSFPSTLKNDGISGDYGTGFLGYALNTATYLVHNDELGWLSFGGNCTEKGKWVKAAITTAAQSRVYVVPSGLWLTLDAGRFKSVSYNTATGDVKIEFEADDTMAPDAYMHVTTTCREVSARKYNTSSLNVNSRGQFVIPLKEKETTITLKQLKE
jgi:hypothetical protein